MLRELRDMLSWMWCLSAHQQHHVEIGGGAFHCRRCCGSYPGDDA